MAPGTYCITGHYVQAPPLCYITAEPQYFRRWLGRRGRRRQRLRIPLSVQRRRAKGRGKAADALLAASPTTMVRLVEGQVVGDDEEGLSGGFLARLLRCRSDTTVNLLGFRVPLYWSVVITLFATLRFGLPGIVGVGILAGEIEQRSMCLFKGRFGKDSKSK